MNEPQDQDLIIVPDEEEPEDDDKDKILNLLDVKKYLTLKKSGEEGPEIKGGPSDALIVHAASAASTGI